MRALLTFTLIFIWAVSSLASPADDLYKQINKQIRAAEREYFNGKTLKAAKLLEKIRVDLDALHEQDPEHRSFKSIHTKYVRLEKKVDKKLAKTPSAPPRTPSKTGAVSQSHLLSHGAKNNLKKAHSEMDRAENELTQAQQWLHKGKYNQVDSYIFNTRNKMNSAQKLLDKVVHNNKANPDHPEVSAAFKRHQQLQHKVNSFAGMAQKKHQDAKHFATQAKQHQAALSHKWMPQLTPYTDVTSRTRLQYPGSYNAAELERQEHLYARAKAVLAELRTELPPSSQPLEVKNAVKNLEFTLQVYIDAKKADGKNRLRPFEQTLAEWENRLSKNRTWDEASGRSLYVIPQKKLEHHKHQLHDLKRIYPDAAIEFQRRLAQIEKSNAGWQEKKRRWMQRPRPFPAAGMKNRSLEQEMKKLLKNREIGVKDLVITDNDWWVQPGEFRYLTAAALSDDRQGKYWISVSFRQLQTLTGYASTEIWEIDTLKIRLP